MTVLDTTKRYTVLGLGVTGQSVVRFLQARGAAVLGLDESADESRKAELEQRHPGLRCELGPIRLACLDDTDVLVVSPGVPRTTPVVEAASVRGLEVVGDIELFARAVTQPVIAVTGTNGKSTVVSMLDACGAASKLNVAVGGNIGIPALDLLAANADLYVLELSSYQLETTSSLAPRAAALLNVTPDHLDRYPGGFADYVSAKQRIFRGAQSCVVPLDDLHAQPEPGAEPSRVISVSVDEATRGTVRVVSHGDGRWISFDDALIAPADTLGAPGAHNLSNACFAVALAREAGIEDAAIRDGLEAFKGLPHRTQFVRELGGVCFINDSKGTNVGATVTALLGMLSPSVLIAGGVGKSQDFSPLAEVLQSRGRALVVFGKDAERIASDVAESVPTHHASSLDEAVSVARSLAQPGDNVLFSPACSSFDMFRNFEERGAAFIDTVEALSA